MTTSHHPRPLVTLGFRIAGLVNVLGVPLFSLGFTNRLLTSLSPEVFSSFGLACIMLWGLAYLAVSRTYHRVPYLVAVFAVEKFVYTATWFVWLSQFGHQLPGVFSASPLTGTFYLIYGPNDLLSGCFFAAVAASTLRLRPTPDS